MINEISFTGFKGEKQPFTYYVGFESAGTIKRQGKKILLIFADDLYLDTRAAIFNHFEGTSYMEFNTFYPREDMKRKRTDKRLIQEDFKTINQYIERLKADGVYIYDNKYQLEKILSNKTILTN